MNIIRLDKLDIFIFGYLKTLNRPFEWEDFKIGKTIASYIDTAIPLTNFIDIKRVLDKRGFLIYNEEDESNYKIKEIEIDLDNIPRSRDISDLLRIYGMRKSVDIARKTNIDKIPEAAFICLIRSIVNYYTMDIVG